MNLRKAPASSMQKTYDECYLICSTAIYFEGQNNEAEALRAWRNALDQIYYHNAYKMPSGYVPRTETEKALQHSLRSMELQCKERVELLETLKKSRAEAMKDADGSGDAPSRSRESLTSTLKAPPTPNGSGGKTWLGGDTVPPATYSDLSRSAPSPAPALPARPARPPRPSYLSKQSSDRVTSQARVDLSPDPSSLIPPPGEQPRRGSRTPSPEKKGGMLKTLRSGPKERTSSGKMASTLRNRPPPAAAKAASQVWLPGQRPSVGNEEQLASSVSGRSASAELHWDPYTRRLVERSGEPLNQPERRPSDTPVIRPPSPSDFIQQKYSNGSWEDVTTSKTHPQPSLDYPTLNPYSRQAFSRSADSLEAAKPMQPPPVPQHQPPSESPATEKAAMLPSTLAQAGRAPPISYLKEYPNHPPANPRKPSTLAAQQSGDRSPDPDRLLRAAAPPRTVQARASPVIPRKAIERAVGVVSATAERQKLDSTQALLNDRGRSDPHASQSDVTNSSPERLSRKVPSKSKAKATTAARALSPSIAVDQLDSAEAAEPNSANGI